MTQLHEMLASTRKASPTTAEKADAPASGDADLFHRAPAGYCTLDADGRIREANLALANLLERPISALLQQPLARFILPEDQDSFGRFRRQLAETDHPLTCEVRMEKKEGGVLWALLTATLVPEADGTPTGHVVLCDVTSLKHKEQFVQSLHVVLAQVNQAIVHFRQPDELFREICRIAVQAGPFRMAWIGRVDEATGQLNPIAHDGHEEGFLKSIHVNVNPNSAFSQGPIGKAILQNRVMASTETDASFQRSPWRFEMLKRGYRAMAAVPFRQNNAVIGTLNLYVEEPCACSQVEMDLLKRIGDTLSFAMECFEIEIRHRRAEAALRESEAQNRAFIHAIPDLVFMNKRNGEYLAVHAPDPRLLAAPAGAILHRRIDELLPKSVAERCLKAIATALDTHELQELTYTIPIDGRKRRFEARIAPCTQETVLTIVRDITELQPTDKSASPRKSRRRSGG